MNLDDIRTAAEQQLAVLQVEMDRWKKILEVTIPVTPKETIEVKTSTNGKYVENAGQIKNEIKNSIIANDVTGEYNISWELEQKVNYFLKIHKRAFSSEEFIGFLKEMEGEAKVIEEYGPNWPMKFNRLRNTTDLIAAKFNNSNRQTFYLLHNWRTDDKRDIKPEHYPTDEAFGRMPLEKRNAQYIQFIGKYA